MLRGINKQQIFFDDNDYRRFIDLLGRYKLTCGYELYAYCLMGNHIHLLICAKKDPLELIFRRIGSSFVYWYNTKYARCGHLFQDRFKSEPVNDERGFLVVLRYILQNPVVAGICSSPMLYPYSSCREYLLSQDGITDKEPALAILNERNLTDFLIAQNDDKCMDIEEFPRRRWTDENAKDLILKEFGTFYPSTGSVKDRDALKDSIRRLIRSGVSVRQLARLSGISKKIIENSLKK